MRRVALFRAGDASDRKRRLIALPAGRPWISRVRLPQGLGRSVARGACGPDSSPASLVTVVPFRGGCAQPRGPWTMVPASGVLEAMSCYHAQRLRAALLLDPVGHLGVSLTMKVDAECATKLALDPNAAARGRWEGSCFADKSTKELRPHSAGAFSTTHDASSCPQGHSPIYEKPAPGRPPGCLVESPGFLSTGAWPRLCIASSGGLVRLAPRNHLNALPCDFEAVARRQVRGKRWLPVDQAMVNLF